MRILIAEDEPISRRLLSCTLSHWGYEVVVTEHGMAAWEELQKPDAAPVAILDWMMPGLDGLALCRRLRAMPRSQPVYILLLTAWGQRQDLDQAVEAGVDDYLIKPFDPAELHARLRVGFRLMELQRYLGDRVRELETALGNVKHLQGLLPVCAWCKKVRDDKNYWQRVEDYIICHTDARVTHGICPECMQREKSRT